MDEIFEQFQAEVETVLDNGRAWVNDDTMGRQSILEWVLDSLYAALANSYAAR